MQLHPHLCLGHGDPPLPAGQEDLQVGRHPHPGGGRRHVLQWLLQGQPSYITLLNEKEIPAVFLSNFNSKL